MTCSGGQVLFIEKGTYGKVKLDGRALGNMSQSPAGETMMDSFGHWTFSNTYIDERANPEQRKAPEAIVAKCCLGLRQPKPKRVTFRSLAK